MLRIARAFRYVDHLAKIDGWLNETTALAIMEILWLQERSGIRGDLAEIGVFRGKSFLALAAGASLGERLVAIDIFDTPDVAAERPEHDVTAYGSGNEASFRANLAEYFPGTEVTVIARSSSDLRGREREFGLTDLRFLSIDGGRTRQLTLNDLRVADVGLAKDGLCCLDDVVNPHWLGVISGLFEFLQSGPALVPVALFPNKLFLSRPARKQFYSDAFRRLFPEALERERLELHRSEVDVYGDIWPRLGTTLQALKGTAEVQSQGAPAPGDLTAMDRASAARGGGPRRCQSGRPGGAQACETQIAAHVGVLVRPRAAAQASGADPTSRTVAPGVRRALLSSHVSRRCGRGRARRIFVWLGPLPGLRAEGGTPPARPRTAPPPARLAISHWTRRETRMIAGARSVPSRRSMPPSAPRTADGTGWHTRWWSRASMR